MAFGHSDLVSHLVKESETQVVFTSILPVARNDIGRNGTSLSIPGSKADITGYYLFIYLFLIMGWSTQRHACWCLMGYNSVKGGNPFLLKSFNVKPHEPLPRLLPCVTIWVQSTARACVLPVPQPDPAALLCDPSHSHFVELFSLCSHLTSAVEKP